MHKNENFDCILCNKSFKRKDHLQRHRSSIHHSKTEVACSKCDKKFARKDNWKKHIKFCCLCRQCYKNFETIKELKEHICNNLSSKEAASANKPVSSLEEGSKASCSSEVSNKKKSLKIKRSSNIEAATCPAAKKSKHDIVEDEQMDETDDDIKEFMKKYWSSIRTFNRKN